MLLIGRKAGTALVIGNDVTVTVVGIHGGRVVLGVQAPRSVAVCRDDTRKYPAPGVGPQPGHSARPSHGQGHKT